MRVVFHTTFVQQQRSLSAKGMRRRVVIGDGMGMVRRAEGGRDGLTR